MLKQDQALPPPRFDTSIFAPGHNGQGLTHKPSKWKKIGGLFKAKNAFTNQDEMHTGEPKPPHEYRQFEKPRKTKERKNSTEEWPKLETEPTPSVESIKAPRGVGSSLSVGTRRPRNNHSPMFKGLS
jgi:hypothetical protein